ncbi:N-acetyltransferase [Nocardia sp. NPDC052001]|uniref:GNAT family N-acetyltransferase n=1 Tax=Nocardia sp. NPDC052001 TaxID=3154853 RepID=UPI00343B605F
MTATEEAVLSPMYRTAELDDLPDIQIIDSTAFRDRPYPYFVLKQLIEGSTRCVVAVEPDTDGEDDVVGYALTMADGGRAWLMSLAVSPERRGSGYGRGLLQRTVEVCLEKGDVDEILLTVDPKNRSAYNLFKDFGFVLHDRDERYFGDDEPRDVLIYKVHRVPDPLPALQD